MTTPTITEAVNTLHEDPTMLDATIDNLHDAVPTIDTPTMAWENEVYSADPTGGAPSAY